MPSSVATLRIFRQIHLYVGVFITPALLFFAFTGAVQTFSLHETTQGSSYKPPAILVTLGQIHKKQTDVVPVRKPRPDVGKPDGVKPDAGADHSKGDRGDHAAAPSSDGKPATPQPAPQSQAPQKSHVPMKVFFLLVAIGLFTSTLTGLYMSYKYSNNKLVVTGLLLAGLIIPPLLLPF